MKNLMNKIRKSNKGFTLVELIIVVAIIAVLSAVVAPQYIKYVERSRQGVDASTLEEVRHAVEVEAAIQETNTASKVTIAGADGDVKTSSGDTAFPALAQVEAVVGDKVTLKSKAAKAKNFKINIDADGKVTWDTASDSDDYLKALQAGTLS